MKPPPSNQTSLLDRVHIVLVEPQHPGNIGAVARAMKNMGLYDLALVNPRSYPDQQATAMAAGARDLLGRARVYANLKLAVANCTRVVGTTARGRYLSQPVSAPKQWANRQRTEMSVGSVALVFGRERTGLTNSELDCCQELVWIPANPDYPSLNLAQAVQILCYELRLSSMDTSEPDLGNPRRQQAQSGDMERFYVHLERTLVDIGFLDENNPRLLMRRLRLLFGRIGPDANELNILRGILTAATTQRRRRLLSRGR